MATSGGNFVSIAHLEIPLLIKMLMCQILIFPAVYVRVCVWECVRVCVSLSLDLHADSNAAPVSSQKACLFDTSHQFDVHISYCWINR